MQSRRDLSKFENGDFDRGASRLVEWTWYAIRFFFFKSAIPFPSWLLCGWLKIFGARIGRNVVVRQGVGVSFPWRLFIGDNVWIGEDVTILSLDTVTIESNVCVSQKAFLCTGSHDFRDVAFALRTKPIRLEAGSWVAAMCFIGPGVTIGQGSVCAAGSVVFESIPPDSLVKGNPAQIVREIELRSTE